MAGFNKYASRKWMQVTSAITPNSCTPTSGQNQKHRCSDRLHILLVLVCATPLKVERQEALCKFSVLIPTHKASSGVAHVTKAGDLRQDRQQASLSGVIREIKPPHISTISTCVERHGLSIPRSCLYRLLHT